MTRPPKAGKPTDAAGALQDQLSHWKQREKERLTSAAPPIPAPVRPVRVAPPIPPPPGKGRTRAPPPPPALPLSPKAAAAAQKQALEDAAYFRIAMEEVSRIDAPATGRTTRSGSTAATGAPHRPADQDAVTRRRDDAESLVLLAESIDTSTELKVRRPQGRPEGRAASIGDDVLKHLRAGDFPASRRVELFALGMTVQVAASTLERQLVEARRAGERCVQLRVLEPQARDHLTDWLSTGRLGRIVLAFAEFPPTGDDERATPWTVLLRRN